MKSFPRLPLARLALLLALVVPLAGCDRLSSLFGDSGTETTSVTIKGKCAVKRAQMQIVCEDDSETNPKGHLNFVEFRLIASGGLTVAVLPVDDLDSKPRQVIFAGLTSDTYSVRHEASDEQGHLATALYRDLDL